MSAASFIPVCEPLLGGRELEYVTKAVSAGWISSSGGYVKEFEQAFAKYLDVPVAVTTTSGTAALHLALLALGVGAGDEVVTVNELLRPTLFATLGGRRHVARTGHWRCSHCGRRIVDLFGLKLFAQG